VLSDDDVEKALEATRITYRGLKLGVENGMTRHAMAQTEGVLYATILVVREGNTAGTTTVKYSTLGETAYTFPTPDVSHTLAASVTGTGTTTVT